MKLILFVAAACLAATASFAASPQKGESSQSKVVVGFNNFAKKSLEDPSSISGLMKVNLLCEGAEGTITIDGKDKEPKPLLSMDGIPKKHMPPAIHGGIWPDSLDFDKYTDRNSTGWTYVYNTPNGTITIDMYKSGLVEMTAQVSSGEHKGKHKAKCAITE